MSTNNVENSPGDSMATAWPQWSANAGADMSAALDQMEAAARRFRAATQGGYANTNRCDRAEVAFRRSSEIVEQVFGPDHGLMGTIHFERAKMYYSQNRLHEAESYFKQAISVLEDAFGENHPAVAGCLRDYATMLGQVQRFAEAEALRRRADQISRTSWN